MNHSKRAVRGKARSSLAIRFEPQNLTSHSGLILFQPFFNRLGLKEKLRSCFRHLRVSPIYGHHSIILLLVVHLILGYRRLRDVDYYRDDEMVKRVLGLRRLPDVSTISRSLASADDLSVEKVRCESRQRVLNRLSGELPARVTLDFDGSVLSTGRRAEGTAVGFNKSKKGARSYYPLYCTVAQTDQVLDVHHRPGNVHDSNGAGDFMKHCMDSVRDVLPGAALETRIDSAFFSEAIVDRLEESGAEFTVSVPFERFTELKDMIEERQRWRRLDDTCSFFETRWKPKSWTQTCRFIFIRKQVRRQDKAPVQLDLFRPVEQGHEFKVIATNKDLSAGRIAAYHEGRGSQEGIFAELKSQFQMNYVPVTTKAGNQLYMLAGILAHNLTRELQMTLSPRTRNTTAKRVSLWRFREMSTLRRAFIHRAGRIIHPAGKPTLSMNSNKAVETELLQSLQKLQALAA